MNCLGRKIFVSYTLFLIILILPIVVKCDNCTVQAICECIVKNETTKVIGGSDGFLEEHSVALNTIDICHPKIPSTTTPVPTPSTTTKKSNVLSSLVNSSAVVIEEQNPHLVLFCEVVDSSNHSTIPKPTKNTTFTLTLNYPCKAPPHADHGYSTGSILVIIFFTCVFAYLGLGIAVRFFLIGARGVEIFPHIDFWRDFPALVRDGAKFLQNGCTARPSDVATTSPEGYDAI